MATAEELKELLDNLNTVLRGFAEQQTITAQQVTGASSTAIPKFENFDCTVEPWDLYLQRFY